MSNPYAPPGLTDAAAPTEAPEVRVDLFEVAEHSFQCGSYSPAALAAELRSEIGASCEQLGLALTAGSQADVAITGVVVTVDEGNQLLRYLIPFLAGASVVHVEGEIHLRNEASRRFRQVVRGQAGAFGGTGRSLVRHALQHIGMYIASEAAQRVQPETVGGGISTGVYYAATAGGALLFSLGVAWFGCNWAATVPKTNNSIKPSDIPVWGAVVGASAFASILLLATALAPTSVLRSRSMLWLVARSGVRSLLGLRAILAIIAVVAGAVCALCFPVAHGS